MKVINDSLQHVNCNKGWESKPSNHEIKNGG